MALILIVEDEQLLRWALAAQLKRAGHNVQAAVNLAEASGHLDKHQPDVMLLDLDLPDGNGLDFYQENKRQFEHTVVIVMTGVGQVDDAVRAMKLGALDFLSKPVDRDELVRLVERSIQVRGDQLELQAARQSRARHLNRELVAESLAFRRVLELVGEVARSDVRGVLLQGESGTGKNLLAARIHALSPRQERPLIEVDCTAAPELVERELFGQARGMISQLEAMRQGAVELADGGTVVLDEIGGLRSGLQGKLLHVLERGRVRRMGAELEIMIDVRIIALTSRDLPEMVQSGRFRQDLFYRLHDFPITVPPLRERPHDILPLARHFLSSSQSKIGRTFDGLSREAENFLLSYTWPGNIRELRNFIERAMLLERSDRLDRSSLAMNPFTSHEPGALQPATDSEKSIIPLDDLERLMMTRALQATGGNQTRAAELLGLTRDQLRYRLKKSSLLA